MIYGIGTDLCDVGRIEKSIARPAFLQHVYTPAEQELFRKRYLEGYTAAELGKMYGLPPATVRTRLAKARRYLSQLLMEE